MKLTLSKKDLLCLSPGTRAEILDYLSSPTAMNEHSIEASDLEYDSFYMSNVAELTFKQVREYMVAVSKWTKAGLRVFAEQGPIIHVSTLVEALESEGSGNYSQFQSRTTLRTRTVTGDSKAYLLGWDEWEAPEECHYAVTQQTYKSLRRYFRLDEGETS